MNLIPQITIDRNRELQFETNDQLPTLEILPYPLPYTPLHNSSLSDKIEEDASDCKATEIFQANPILPPGRHHLREQRQFRLKFINQRDKFNRTSLALANMQTQSFNSTNQGHFIDCKKQQKKYKQDNDSDIQEDVQLAKLLQHQIEIYRRLNNSKINQIGKERIMCSFFFDFRKQKLQAKDQPVYQTLARQKGLTWNNKNTDWLSFSSAFQSGNLLMALRNPITALPTYELYMQNDVNTKGCTQWYYFSVINRTRGKAKLRLMNFYKPTSLYQKGMKVLCSSDRLDWKRTGTAITYSAEPGQKEVYCLQFLHDFDTVNSITYFAYGYPYTYTVNLMHYLNCLSSDMRFQKITKKTNLCLSAMGNPIPMLSISNFANKKQPRQLVYIIGRQHPGQTPASFIIEGLINFLICNCQEAKQLRDKYQFRIVPMVNVDGVISGNYRSNLSGNDVNRQWQFPSKKGQPQIYWLKQQIANNKKQVAFFLDIHAHSRKMNSFFYGSKSTEKDNRLLPFVCSKLNKFISYSDSSFSDDPSKKTTARVVLENQLNITHSLTFQVSFYGWVDPLKQSKYSFKQSDLRGIGESLGLGLYYTLIGIQRAKKYEQPKQNVLPKCQNEKERSFLNKSLKMLQKWNKQCEKENKIEEEDAYSQGSSLDPEQYQLREEERQLIIQISNNQPLQKDNHTNKLIHHFSVPKQEQIRKDKRKVLIYNTLSPGQNPQSKLLAPKNIGSYKGQSNLGISSGEFYHFSNSAKATKKQLFSVRELQLQLQYGINRSPQKQLRGTRLRMNRLQLSALDRYQSMSMQREASKNYKLQVLQMKRALKYLLQSKSTDYQNYQSCFKSITGDSSKGN